VEFHQPKPVHSLREFLGEVAVVVLGIVIALTGEQTLQHLEWRHKIRLANADMRQEISGDDGPQALERIALAPCIDRGLGSIRHAVEQDAGRPGVIEAIDRFWTPRHTWDSIAFQSALSSGVLAQAPVQRVAVLSRFYSLMPVLERANEREFRDGAALGAISTTGGALTDEEQGRVLSAVERLRRDDAEIHRLAMLAEASMTQLGISIRDYRPLGGRVSPLQDPQRVITEMQREPMAQACVGGLEKSLQSGR
jgi:hypothetical protein